MKGQAAIWEYLCDVRQSPCAFARMCFSGIHVGEFRGRTFSANDDAFAVFGPKLHRSTVGMSTRMLPIRFSIGDEASSLLKLEKVFDRG